MSEIDELKKDQAAIKKALAEVRDQSKLLNSEEFEEHFVKGYIETQGTAIITDLVRQNDSMRKESFNKLLGLSYLTDFINNHAAEEATLQRQFGEISLQIEELEEGEA